MKSLKSANWDLSSLYSSQKDPRIKSDKKEILALTELFTKKYRGKVADKLLLALKDCEKIEDLLSIYTHYAYFTFCTNSNDTKAKAFYQAASEFETLIYTKLVWFNLEIKAIDDKLFRTILKDPQIKKDYGYFLTRLRVFIPHTKSEPEELVLLKKSQTGRDAFARFFSEWTAALTFPVGVNGKKLEVPLSDMTKYTSNHPDRKVRKSATEAVTKVFSDNSNFFTFVFNTLILDTQVNTEIRNYSQPDDAALLSYDIDRAVVEAMVKAVTIRFDIVKKYYTTKRKVVGLKTLYEWDRYSPLFPHIKTSYAWDESKNLVLGAFRGVSDDFYENAKKFFDNNWIDAEVKKGKRGGGFCAYGSKSVNPFILINFSGELSDITTLAHELGHGVHALFAKENNSLTQSNPSTATAEIASIFAESLVFDKLLSATIDPNVKLELLANKIQGCFASVFRQTQFYLFEKRLHGERKLNGELSHAQISKYYHEMLQEMFGDSLTLTKEHGFWWSYISHFYHSPFYVFTYAFGELLSLALYANFKTNPKSFISKYLRALAAGGSASPHEIILMMDIDIKDPSFWGKGLTLLEEYVDEFAIISAKASLA